MKKSASFLVLAACLAWTALSHADDQVVRADATNGSDRTGGASTTPTLIFTPAAALPAMTSRVTAGAEGQTTAGAYDKARPIVSAEVGLGRGFTVGAGSHWFGGDGAHDLSGLSPYAQLRYQLFGSADGYGLLGGTSLTYKRIGYAGSQESEAEGAFSLQYRKPTYELGAQGVFGQSFKDAGEHDVEGHGYGGYRVIPELLVGFAGQLRAGVGEREANSPKATWDGLGGAMVSATLGVFQIGTLAGVSTIGLPTGSRVSPAGQVFGSFRF